LDRKRQWKQQKEKSGTKKANAANDQCSSAYRGSYEGSVCLSMQSIEEFQQWLSRRKITWRKERLRKRIELQLEHSEKLTTEEACITAVEIKLLEKLEETKRTRDAVWSPVQTSKNQILVQKTKKPAQYKRKSAQPFDFRKIGVRQSASGKWAVEISHKNKLRHIGTFNTLDSAELANRIARNMLNADAEEETEPLCAEHVETRVKSARGAARKAAFQLEDRLGIQPLQRP